LDERLKKLAEEATAGLQADPELRLDVQHELQSHLERSAETFREEGCNEEESLEQAAKVFGTPLELAGNCCKRINAG